MSSDLSAVLISLVTYVMWVLLPLVPAILIYRLFPNTEVGLGGPLAGLTLKAGGAFAGYFATLLASIFFVNTITDEIHDLSKSYWILDARLAVRDEQGREIPTPQSGVTVSFDPTTVSVSGDQVTAFVPGSENEWPKVRVDVSGYGAHTFVLDQRLDYSVDRAHHILRINEPLIIRRPPAVGFGVLPPTGAAAAAPASTSP